MSTNRIGRYIEKKREERGLSQRRLANILNNSYHKVDLWEKGKIIPDRISMMTIASVFNVPLDVFINMEG